VRVHDAEMNDVADVRQLFDGLYESLAAGDSTPWADALAEDALVIGTDEAEWWQGRDTAMKFIGAQVQELHEAGLRYSGSDPQVSAAGDVVWVADRPTAALGDGTTIPMRLTVVATRDGGSLTIRQMHLSVGAANEDVLQQELTV
jgi:ketosteroid isomerase-like protein